MNSPPPDAVSAIIREVSTRIVMPGFRNLTAPDILEKKPGDLVTKFDIAAEVFLSEHLCALVPGSHFLGEECYEDAPELMGLMDTEGPVWIVDPIDGTGNFSRGRECFAVMVAFRNDGVTQGGWIYDPVSNCMLSAEKGKGVLCNGEQLRPSSDKIALRHLSGSIGTRLSKRLDFLRAQSSLDAESMPTRVQRYRCCGREYMDFSLGRLHYIQYGISLKPWDHAPGILIAQEAGLYAAFLEDGSLYDASGGIKTGHLMAATDEATWNELHDLLWA